MLSVLHFDSLERSVLIAMIRKGSRPPASDRRPDFPFAPSILGSALSRPGIRLLLLFYVSAFIVTIIVRHCDRRQSCERLSHRLIVFCAVLQLCSPYLYPTERERERKRER